MAFKRINSQYSIITQEEQNFPTRVYLEDKDGRRVQLDANYLVTDKALSALPPNCFYLKWWGDSYQPSLAAVVSGWLKVRPDIPIAATANVDIIPVFELLNEKLTRAETKKMVREWQI